MCSRIHLVPLIVVIALIVAPIAAQGPVGGQSAADRHKSGHSKLGEAFDEGPRERPAKIDGIGRTSFPITTSKPEVQAWFDQGHTLLHSFWFFEAERSFRWAVKLDPDAPMPYWGLARTASGDRARERSCARPRAARRAAPSASATTSRHGRCNTRSGPGTTTRARTSTARSSA